jgi:hypothetical protein
VDEELPLTVKQTIAAPKSMISIFVHPHSFPIVEILPEKASFNAAYFIDCVVTPLAQLHARAARIMPVANSDCISTIPPATRDKWFLTR